jgi:hypothetical protein
MGFQWDLHQVCWTNRSPTPDGIGEVAALPALREHGRVATWFDLHPRDRVFEVAQVLCDTPDLFEFETVAGLRLSLRPLTLADWARQREADPQLWDFDTEADLHAFVVALVRGGGYGWPRGIEPTHKKLR